MSGPRGGNFSLACKLARSGVLQRPRSWLTRIKTKNNTTDLILRPDGSIEEPQEKLVKQDVIERFGLLASPTEDFFVSVFRELAS